MDRYTDHLQLRAPELNDVVFMHQLENDEEIMEASYSTGLYSQFQIAQYIESNQNDLYADRQQRFVIEHDTDGSIGTIDLFSFEPRCGRIEVGIAVSAPFRSRGVASWALSKIEQHCFSYLNLHQIYAYVSVSNLSCIKLFRKAGYHESALIKDWAVSGKAYTDVYLFQKING